MEVRIVLNVLVLFVSTQTVFTGAEISTRKPRESVDLSKSIGSYSTEFLFLIPENVRSRHTKHSQIFVVISTLYSNVTSRLMLPLVTNINNEYRVNPDVNKPVKIKLPSEVMHFLSRVSNRGIEVISTHPVSVQVVNNQRFSSGGFSVIPTDQLSVEYYVVTVSSGGRDSPFIAVMSGETKELIVIITLSVHPNIQIEFEGVTYRAGSAISQKLSPFRTLQLKHSSDLEADLSGTHIHCTRRCVVMSGNCRAQISGLSSRDHLVDEMIGVDKWGKIYAVPHTEVKGNLSVSALLKIVCRDDNTFVSVDSRSFRCNRGDFIEEFVTTSGAHVISASRAVLVTRLTTSQLGAESEYWTDPSLVVLPTEDQFSPVCQFSTVNYQRDTEYRYYQLSIITRETLLNTFEINGRSMKLNETGDVEVVPASRSPEGHLLLSVWINVEFGDYILTNTNSHGVFSCMLLARNDRQAYSYIVNKNLRTPGTSTCSKKLVASNLTVINDC